MKRVVFLIALLLVSLSFVSAHQPRIVYDKEVYGLDVKNPEVSQAFYGELKGQPEYYKISSDTDFQFYLQITAPDIKDARTDFVFEVYKDYNVYFTLNGSEYNWTKFHEEFANDDYLSGPEYDRQVPPGDYLIKVFNKDNAGKYVLVVGKKESFPLGESLGTIMSLPKLKVYFDKSSLSAYWNRIGLYFVVIPFLVIIVIFIILLLLVRWLFVRKRNRK